MGKRLLEPNFLIELRAKSPTTATGTPLWSHVDHMSVSSSHPGPARPSAPPGQFTVDHRPPVKASSCLCPEWVHPCLARPSTAPGALASWERPLGEGSQPEPVGETAEDALEEMDARALGWARAD